MSETCNVSVTPKLPDMLTIRRVNNGFVLDLDANCSCNPDRYVFNSAAATGIALANFLMHGTLERPEPPVFEVKPREAWAGITSRSFDGLRSGIIELYVGDGRTVFLKVYSDGSCRRREIAGVSFPTVWSSVRVAASELGARSYRCAE